jgi:hypothetical protein
VYGIGSDKQVYARVNPGWPWYPVNGTCCATGIEVARNATFLAVRDTDNRHVPSSRLLGLRGQHHSADVLFGPGF